MTLAGTVTGASAGIAGAGTMRRASGFLVLFLLGAPTVRAQGQTYQIARRLSGGEHLFEEPQG